MWRRLRAAKLSYHPDQFTGSTPVFGEEFVTRWIVDVELYHRLGHERILECPVLAGSISPTLRSAFFASLRRSWGIYFASAANKIVGVKPVPILILS